MVTSNCKNKGPTCKVHLYFFIELTPGMMSKWRVTCAEEMRMNKWRLYVCTEHQGKGLFIEMREVKLNMLVSFALC